MRFLVTGAGGMLGHDVVRAVRHAGHDVAGFARADLDVTDPAAVAAAFAAVRPDVVVNCAAWTDVDGAEAHEDAAGRVNGAGAANVATAAGQVGARIVQVSTDYVFDGRGGRPYVESDATAPLSAYGRTKLAGERAVAAANPDHAVVRTSWLFGSHGGNFVATMLRLGAERDEVRVVDDQVGCPTWTGHLAPALVALGADPARGLFHVAGGGQCSWYDLAVATFADAGFACRVERGRTEDLGRPAPRPALSVLRSERSETPALPAWREGLRAYLTERGALATTGVTA